MNHQRQSLPSLLELPTRTMQSGSNKTSNFTAIPFGGSRQSDFSPQPHSLMSQQFNTFPIVNQPQFTNNISMQQNRPVLTQPPQMMNAHQKPDITRTSSISQMKSQTQSDVVYNELVGRIKSLENALSASASANKMVAPVKQAVPPSPGKTTFQPTINAIPTTLRVVGTYKPASDKTIYAQPFKEKDFSKQSIETVIHVGTPIIGASQAYGRTFSQGSQHTPTNSVPTTYQRASIGSSFVQDSTPNFSKNTNTLLSTRPMPLFVPADYIKTPFIKMERRSLLAEPIAQLVDTKKRVYDQAPNENMDENASKVRAKFREMLGKYTDMRYNKMVKEHLSMLDDMENKNKSLSFVVLQGTSKALQNKIKAEPVDQKCPMIAVENYEPTCEMRMDTIQSKGFAEKLKKFECFTFSDLPQVDIRKYKFGMGSTQYALSRHFDSMLPKTLNQQAKVPPKTCNQMHIDVFSQLETLMAFDTCYETSVWDYDPRFTIDYLPGTKRGMYDLPYFVYKVSYLDDENKWRKYTEVLSNISRQKMNEQLNESADVVPENSIRIPVDDKAFMLNNLMSRYYEFPEHLISEDYCGICEKAFTSILSSIAHYFAPVHMENVVENVRLAAEQIMLDNDHHCNPTRHSCNDWFINTIRGVLKKYKIKPDSWSCDLCDVALCSEVQAKLHFSGLSHKKKANDALSFRDQMITAEIHMRREIAYEEPPAKKLRNFGENQTDAAFMRTSLNKSHYI